ncbi:hypothetical protein V8E55_005777 [Tylopilus felleus]
MAQAQTASQREYEQQLQIQSLQATVTQLQAENQVLKAAKVSYDALKLPSDPTMTMPNQISVSHSGHAPALPPPIPLPPPLNEEAYPLVQFWTQEKFKAWEKGQSAKRQGARQKRDKDNSKESSDEPASESGPSLAWLEDKYGNPLNKDTVTAILKKMRAIWQSFKQRSMAPATWGAARDEVKTTFYSEVITAFPQMRLCSNNWKSEAVATEDIRHGLKQSTRGGKRKVIVSDGLAVGSAEPDSKRIKASAQGLNPAVVEEIEGSNSSTAPPSRGVSETASNSTSSGADSEPAATTSSTGLSGMSTASSTLDLEEFPIVKNPLATMQKNKNAVRHPSVTAVHIQPPRATATTSSESPTSTTAPAGAPQATATSSESASAVAQRSEPESTTTSESTTAIASTTQTPSAAEQAPAFAETTPAGAAPAMMVPAAVPTAGIAKVNPGGTGTQFAVYWKGLSDAQKKQYKDECTTLAATNGWAAYTGEVINTLAQGTLY